MYYQVLCAWTICEINEARWLSVSQFFFFWFDTSVNGVDLSLLTYVQFAMSGNETHARCCTIKVWIERTFKLIDNRIKWAERSIFKSFYVLQRTKLSHIRTRPVKKLLHGHWSRLSLFSLNYYNFFLFFHFS